MHRFIINNNTNISIYMKKLFTLTALLFCMLLNVMADDVTTATYGNATGNTERTITVALNHSDYQYCAFMLDLTLPVGATIAEDKITAKAPLKNGGTTTINGKSEDTDFIISGKLQSDGKYRIIGYNFGNVAIGEGDILLTIPVKTTSGVAFNAGAVTASNVTFINKTASGYNEITFEGEKVKADQRLWGDVNQDHSISPIDINMITGIYLQNTSLSEVKDPFAADVNNDGSISPVDVNAVTNIYLQK